MTVRYLEGFRVFADSVPWNNQIRFFVLGRQIGAGGVVEDVALVATPQVQQPAAEASCFAAFDKDQGRAFLQAWVDAAYEIGITPTGMHDASRELKAVREHLDDIRRIAKITEKRGA